MLTSCNLKNAANDKDNVLAAVGETILYKSVVKKILGEKYNDIRELKNYVENWVVEQSLIEKAKVQLTAKEQDFGMELERY